MKSKQQAPYMRHELRGPVVQDMHFCPFDDVLGIGHSGAGTRSTQPVGQSVIGSVSESAHAQPSVTQPEEQRNSRIVRNREAEQVRCTHTDGQPVGQLVCQPVNIQLVCPSIFSWFVSQLIIQVDAHRLN